MSRCPSGKVRHRSRGKARKAAANLKETKGLILAHYWCNRCYGWHLGNTPATRVINVNSAIDRALESDAAKKELTDRKICPTPIRTATDGDQTL